MHDLDQRIWLAVFNWLEGQVRIHGDVLPRTILSEGFQFEGLDGLLMYRYRGTDPQHRDNAGLRMALFRKAPLVYFHGIVPGKYLAVWPFFIVGDDPDKLTFKVAVDDLSYAGTDWQAGLERGNLSESASEGRMAYLTTAVRQRLHQRGFRETSPSS